MYKFEKLTVWQESMILSELCYKLSLSLPNYERNGLSDQLRRAVTSVSLNIAEGSGSDTDRDFLRFLYLARKSLFEVITILKFTERVHKNIVSENIYDQTTKVSKLLSGLINTLKKSAISK